MSGSMKIGKVLRAWRLHKEYDLRRVGRQIGISAATLMRLEQGHLVGGVTLVKVLRWLLDVSEQPRKETP